MANLTICEISRWDLGDLPSSESSDSRITDLRHLASYNWLEQPRPTIQVPGCSPLWCPPPAPHTLQPDSGLVNNDQNAARNPSFPLEPLFRALYAEKPDFHIGGVDIVTDRNNIRKLLRFIRGTFNEAFQINVEIAGDRTALFTRVSAHLTELIQHFKGYGHKFEDACTKTDPGSTGHHRIIRSAEPAESLSDESKEPSTANSDSTNLKSTAPVVQVCLGGKAVEKTSILELKTRSDHRLLDMVETVTHLWISQTPNLVVGYHSNGVFGDCQPRDLTLDIQNWEKDIQGDLVKLAGLMKKIVEVVKQSKGRSAVVKYGGGTTLQILSGDGKKALPDDLYTKWEVKEQ